MSEVDTASAAEATEEDPKERRKRMAKVGMQLAWWAEQQPDVTAIVSEHGNRTYGELNANVNRLVRALRRRGVVVGDAVALACRNRAEFVEANYATQRGGYRLTTVNWHLTGDEAGYIIENCEAKALIADTAVAEMARKAADDAPACSVLLAVGGPIDGFEDYASVIAAEDGSDIDDPSPGSSMLYTSGTTGKPKGVHRPPAKEVAASVNIYDYHEGEGDVHLCTGPLYHAAPLAFSLMAPLAFGATVVLMDAWDAEGALALIDEHGVTHTHMVPTMFHRLLSLPEDTRARYSTERRAVPGAGQAAADRLARPDRGRVLRRHRGCRQLRRLDDMAGQAGHRGPAHDRGSGPDRRRGGQRAAAR